MDNITYKVLWIDEEERLVEGMRRNADLYGIELDWYTNWEDGRNALERDFQSYSAIILDAKCKLKADKMISMDFLPTVLGELKGIFAKKANALPWYVLSAGGWENFDFVMGIINNMREGHEQWGTFLYYKDPTLDNPQNVKTLFKKIVEVASKQTYNKVLSRHADAFKYMGEGKLVGGEARSIMLDMLSAMYSPEEFPRYNHEGNPLRKVIECIYAGAHKYGLLPDECYNEITGYNLRNACSYLGGRETLYLEPTNKRFGGEKDYILPNHLYYTLNAIQTLCNKDSHVNPKKEIGVDLPDGELFMGCALQLCYIIRYLGHYVEAHPDVEANKSKIRDVAATGTYQIKNKPVKPHPLTRIEAHPLTKVETHPLTKDDVVGEVYTVLYGDKYMFAGSCKLLNANGRDYPVGTKVKILEVEENTDGDKKRLPFIATRYEKVTNA